jgi:hypothetical protein
VTSDHVSCNGRGLITIRSRARVGRVAEVGIFEIQIPDTKITKPDRWRTPCPAGARDVLQCRTV